MNSGSMSAFNQAQELPDYDEEHALQRGIITRLYGYKIESDHADGDLFCVIHESSNTEVAYKTTREAAADWIIYTHCVPCSAKKFHEAAKKMNRTCQK